MRHCNWLLIFSFAAFHAHAATFYVSKLGDNSSGSSWKTAFATVQRALDAVPDDAGGHRIVIRPDTYMEANLFPAHRGAKGKYNTIEADFDGKLGSGATGYAVLDSSDPAKGLRSIDWWSPFKANPHYSGVVWDRWVVRHVYATGGDAGLFWDLPPKIEPFTIVVEDSVGMGRAFGGGAAHYLARADEPIVFRHCYLGCLDWWGDACGAYVRAENESMPEHPDITFEDCTLAGPDNALQSGNPGFASYSHIKLKNSRLISLNFSQPRGTPGTGIIYATIDGKFMRVDLEDCELMGYKIFGAKEGEIDYSITGSVRAYVQYEQPIPKSIITLGAWPVDLYRAIAPPQTRFSGGSALEPEGPGKATSLIKEPFEIPGMVEVSPVVWNERQVLLQGVRPASGGEPTDLHLELRDVETCETLATFAVGYGLPCAFVNGDTFYAFAARFENKDWNDVTMFWSKDLKTWERKVVIQQENEHLFNSSVCAGPDGFVMAYETNDPKFPAFTVKFATSKDLMSWTKLPNAVFGTDRYTACPCIRYANGFYYMIYLEHRAPRWFFESFIARSPDLAAWELGDGNPVLTPDRDDEGINASDVDIQEWAGKTYLYYNVGDQRTWGNVKRAVYNGPAGKLFAQYFPMRDGGAP